VAQNLLTFVGDKHAANFRKQFRICCNVITITENLDFIIETNILGTTIPDSIKARKPETFTPVGDIDSYGRSICRKYIKMRAINSGIPVAIKYFLNIPMTSVNLFDKLRYLPKFFGNWILAIVPTLDNMIMNVIDNNGVETNACTHLNKEMAYQCYGVGTPCYYPAAVIADPVATWFKLTPQF
jgi:hypothetical protein